METSELIIESDAYMEIFHYNNGEDKIESEVYKGDLQDYTKSIDLDPNDGISYFSRGYCKQELQDFDGACIDALKSKELGYDSKELIDEVCN